MPSGSKHSKNNKSSIRYWWIPLDVQSFDPNIDFANGDGYQKSSSHTKTGKPAETRSSSNLVSTSQFLTAVAGLWDIVGQPPSQQTKESSSYDEIHEKEDSICYSNGRKHRSAESSDREKNSNDFIPGTYVPSSAKSDFENLKEIKRTFLSRPCNMDISKYLIWSDYRSSLDTCRCDEVANIGVPKDLVCENGSITTKPYFALKDPSNSASSGLDGADERSITGYESSPDDQSSTQSIENNDTNQDKDTFVGQYVNITENVVHPPKLLDSTYSLRPVPTTEETVVESMCSSSNMHLDYNSEVLKALEQSQQSTNSSCVAVESLTEVPISNDPIVHENCTSLIYEDIEEDYFPKQWLSVKDKVQNTFAKNKHPLAGALAGTMVSLSLHPVDTVKTIIQANAAGQLSPYLILRRVISEKGVSGLYRGISSNIASSAPISAIYTYTYESVKGALLPVLPKEYHSFALCIAGGCSSVATSFIFTPSERIKQQMQVGLQYQNSWNALIGCLEKGGMSSLYAGWGAVLCRNIPHSIIKFYTYESLKQFLLTSAKPGASPSTLQTLVCGGIAGSTAALFTTPFDVVKTRLQTQVPGSLAKYDGVLHALQEIARREGLQGLYSGLTPRLAMYVSQGAIFFASYEFLKAAFSLDVPQSSRVMDNEENVDAAAAAGAASRLQK